jgi:ribosomal protein S18 acetylase RimI-like enzyme
MSALEAIRRQAEAPELAGPEQAAGVVDDLAAAFDTDPVLTWLLKPGPGRPAALLAFFRLIVGVAMTENPRIYRPAGGGAAAIWLRSEDLRDPGFLDELRALSVFLKGSGLSRMPRVMAVRKAMDANHPMQRPHDYLYFLGVRPQFQGAGVGTRLLRPHLERLDASARPAFLETGNERTLSLYRSAGFEVI